jgi:hypothetical protein
LSSAAESVKNLFCRDRIMFCPYSYNHANPTNLKGKPMKKLLFLLVLTVFFSAGCAALSGRQSRLPKATHRGTTVLSDFICSPVGGSGQCQTDSTESSISSIQNDVKITLRFLSTVEKEEKIRGEGVFSEKIFAAVSLNIENSASSKIRLPLSQAVLICGTEQLDVLSYKAAVLLAVSSTADYAQRAAEPYLKAGLSPTYARQQVVSQSFQAIHQESGLTNYEWMDEKPNLTIFPTVRISRVLLWDTAKLAQKFKEEEQIRIIIPDVVLRFDPAGNPSEAADFWFDFQIQEQETPSR